jgi:hypothetical protein
VSSRISEKKNFNFGMHLDFHNHEKVIWGLNSRKQYL